MIFADQVSCALLTREAIPSSSAQSHANKHWRSGQTVLLAARYASSSASVFFLALERVPASRKATEEGEVHCTPPPHQHRLPSDVLENGVVTVSDEIVVFEPDLSALVRVQKRCSARRVR